MMKTEILCFMLLALAVSAEILEFDNNFIEYGDFRPAQSISLPYPYHTGRDKTVVIEPMPTVPVYSNTYGNLIVPTATEVQPAGLLTTALTCAFDAVKGLVVFFLTNGPALLAGSVVALGICKLTSLCDSQVTIYEAQSELRSYATPERLSSAANFVKEAVKKFSEMQEMKMENEN